MALRSKNMNAKSANLKLNLKKNYSPLTQNESVIKPVINVIVVISVNIWGEYIVHLLQVF